MKYLYLLLLLTPTTGADEFDWSSDVVKITRAELSGESGNIHIIVGSLCAADTGLCDISAKFSKSINDEVEFLRELTNSEAKLIVVENTVELSLVYYPFGWDEGLSVKKYYEWNSANQMLEMINSIEESFKI
ncbi:MAG: hypothetical protein K6L75_08100 [Cellvibrionaceae bacterium]